MDFLATINEHIDGVNSSASHALLGKQGFLERCMNASFRASRHFSHWVASSSKLSCVVTCRKELLSQWSPGATLLDNLGPIDEHGGGIHLPPRFVRKDRILCTLLERELRALDTLTNCSTPGNH